MSVTNTDTLPASSDSLNSVWQRSHENRRDEDHASPLRYETIDRARRSELPADWFNPFDVVHPSWIVPGIDHELRQFSLPRIDIELDPARHPILSSYPDSGGSVARFTGCSKRRGGRSLQ